MAQCKSLKLNFSVEKKIKISKVKTNRLNSFVMTRSLSEPIVNNETQKKLWTNTIAFVGVLNKGSVWSSWYSYSFKGQSNTVCVDITKITFYN